jgi:hypothetical protein
MGDAFGHISRNGKTTTGAAFDKQVFDRDALGYPDTIEGRLSEEPSCISEVTSILAGNAAML